MVFWNIEAHFPPTAIVCEASDDEVPSPKTSSTANFSAIWHICCNIFCNVPLFSHLGCISQFDWHLLVSGWILLRRDRAVGAESVRVPIGNDATFSWRALAGLSVVTVAAAGAAMAAAAAVAADADHRMRSLTHGVHRRNRDRITKSGSWKDNQMKNWISASN